MKALGLSRLFYHFGVSVAKHPLRYIAATCLLSLFSIGLIRVNLEDRIRDGYTPLNSDSRRETEIYKEFVGSNGEPLFTVFIIRANDGGSVIRPEHLHAVVELIDFVVDDFNITVAENVFRYRDLCGAYCNYNAPISLFKAALDEQMEQLAENKSMHSYHDLKYPMAKIHGIEISLYKHFHGVTSHDEYSRNASNVTLPTSIADVQLFLLIFRADKTPAKFVEGLDILYIWENAIYNYIRLNYDNEYIMADVVGTDVLSTEIIRGGKATVPFFVFGFAIMAVFVLVSVLGSAAYYSQLDGGKFLVALGTLLSPLLAVSSTLGFTSLLGLRINSMTLVAPFLVMAIGVDDAFLMIHSWHRLSLNKKSANTIEKLGAVLEEVGPSITITSVTNTLAFGIGAFTPTPEIQLFCRTAALSMALDFVFELTLFAPILALAVRFERNATPGPAPQIESRKQELKLKVRTLMTDCLRGYSKFLAKPYTALVAVALSALFWTLAVMGAVRIQPKLDGQKLLPKDSPLLEADRLLRDTVWSEHHPVSVLINKAPNISNETELKLFDEMVNEFESMDRAVGSGSTMLWLVPYRSYFRTYQAMEDAALGWLDFWEEEENKETGPLTYAKVPDFLQQPQYQHYSSDLVLSYINDTATVRRFLFTTVYRNTSEWSTKVDLMLRWRAIARNHSLWNVTVWEASSHFIDQILSLKSVTVQSVLITLSCMGLVCLLFIPSPCSVLCASWAIASISIGVFGFLSWWGMDLDPVTMSATLMSIGLSVDFTAHVSYHYRSTGELKHNGLPLSRPERLMDTLEAVGFPMVQAGFSTLFCVLPLALLQSYPPDVFLKAIVLVVAWGWLHGLFILPVVLAAMPHCMTGTGCDTSHTREWQYASASEAQPEESAPNEIELERL